MFNVAVTAILLSILFALSMGHKEINRVRAVSNESAVIAMNMNVYGASVARYVRNNPSFVGEIPFSDLNLPDYFNPWAGLSNRITEERSYVFIETLDRDIKGYVLRHLEDTNPMAGFVAGAGHVRAGRLTTSSGADLGAVFSGLPNGTLVAVY